MFRPMRRIKQQVSHDKCIELLQNAPRGVLSLHGENGYPYALPMNHFYHEGKLYFHSAQTGHKIDALSQNGKACFCVMDEGFRNPDEWMLHIHSVVVFGHLSKVENTAEILAILQKLGEKHYPTKESVNEIVQEEKMHVQMLEMTIDHMTGKLVKEC